MVKNNWFTH